MTLTHDDNNTEAEVEGYLIKSNNTWLALLSDFVPQRVISILDKSWVLIGYDGYGFIHLILDTLHKHTPLSSVLEIWPSVQGLTFLRDAQDSFPDISFCALDKRDLQTIALQMEIFDCHRGTWEDMNDIFGDRLIDLIYHHRLWPQGYRSNPEFKFRALGNQLQAWWYYIGVKRCNSENPDPIPSEFFRKAGYAGWTLEIRNLSAWVEGDRDYFVTIFQKPAV